MDNKELTILVLLDFSNAFNSVDFDVLLGTLRSLNLSLPVIDWFHSYLHGRRQSIRSDDVSSDWANVIAGVPQGGVLSPLLFSIFINQITEVITSHYHLYADDLQLYRHATLADLNLAVHNINLDLNSIREWTESFGLLVNPIKSQAMIIGNSQLRGKIDFNTIPNIVYHGTYIPYVNICKNLGLTIDCHLSWRAQVNEVCKRIHFSLHSLKRLQNFLPLQTKRMLAQSLLLPLLDYADVCYLDATEELLNKLDRLQNLCIRFIFGLRKFDHVSQYRLQLRWLPIRLRRNMNILIFLFKILKNSSPSYLHERFQFSAPKSRPVRTCVPIKPLEVPHRNTVFYDKSFTVVATQLWNSLPENIRCISTIHTFKLKLKQHFLSIAT